MSINNNNNNNNNKRDIDIDKDILDNEINKKQKIDNNNENNNNDIDISNLKQHTVNKLKEIEASIGIHNKSNIKKQDLIDQITYLLNKKQETIKQNEIVDNINSFNKVVVEFKIKDGIDELEWLFWKIFRNKFIYKRIMSFMDTHITQTYESITRVDKMIKSNQLYMLHDKVIRNQYLVFNGGYFSNNNNSKDNIFNIFNQFKQDELFYKSLFKNYNKYIPGFDNNEISTKESILNRESVINHVINSNNILALNILIQDYNFKPTNRNLNHSIENGKLKFIKLLLQPKFNLRVKLEDLIDHIKDQPSVNIKIYKGLNYLHDEKLLQLNQIKNHIAIITIDEKTRLKELISIIKFIINSTTTDTLVKDQQQQQQQHIQQQQQLIDLNQFTKDELKLEITSTSLAHHKQSLKSFIEFYYIFGKLEKSNDIPSTDLFYHLYLCDNENLLATLNMFNNSFFDFCIIDMLENQPHNVIVDKYTYYLQISLECGSFKTLDHISRRNYLNRNGDKFSEFILSNHLFAFCKQDKEKQIQFLNSFIYLTALTSEECFCLLIVYDDVEFVKQFSNGISKLKNLMDIISNIRNITSYIKSNEMLEYLFNQYYSLVSNSIFSFQNIQLLIKFEELYKMKFTTNNLQISYNEYIYPSSKFVSKEVLVHILSNPSFYKIKSEVLYIIVLTLVDKFSYETIFEMCKLLYLNYQSLDNYIFNGLVFDTLTKSIGFIKFIDWLFNYKQEDINHYFQNIAFVLFRAGRYNSINKDQEIPIKELFDYRNIFEDIKILDYYLNRLASTPAIEFNKINGANLVFNILYNCIACGRLKSLEHIYQNHNWVFRTKKPTSSSSNDNIVINGYSTTPIILKNIFSLFLQYGYFDLSEIIFHIVSFTQNEFNKHANDVSKSYFKNKKFK